MNRGQSVGARDERGSGTLLVAAVALIAMVVAGVGVVLGCYVVAQHAAAGAADLSALSGAAAEVRGEDACEAAGRVARANDTNLVACEVSGDSFDVVVEVRVVKHLRPPPGLPTTVTASAQAGRLTG